MQTKDCLKQCLLLAMYLFSSVALAQTLPQADPVDTSSGPSQNQTTQQPSLQAPAESSGPSSIQSDQSSGGMPSLTEPSPAAAEPAPRIVSGITYICGGVGEDEANRMKQAARDHGLMLTFATRSGSYLADVKIDITDTRGKPVFKTTCDAPIMLIDLPKGATYRIRAETKGHAITRIVRIPGKGRTNALVLVWPSEAVDTDKTSQTSSDFIKEIQRKHVE